MAPTPRLICAWLKSSKPESQSGDPSVNINSLELTPSPPPAHSQHSQGSANCLEHRHPVHQFLVLSRTASSVWQLQDRPTWELHPPGLRGPDTADLLPPNPSLNDAGWRSAASTCPPRRPLCLWELLSDTESGRWEGSPSNLLLPLWKESLVCVSRSGWMDSLGAWGQH